MSEKHEKHHADTEMRSLGMLRLTAFAIGTTLASGIFSLSGDFAANGAYPLAVMLGWLIAGVGMFFLCMCFHRLSVIRPELTSGIYAYSEQGFGKFIGYSVAWGYWMSAILASVTFLRCCLTR